MTGGPALIEAGVLLGEAVKRGAVAELLARAESARLEVREVRRRMAEDLELADLGQSEAARALGLPPRWFEFAEGGAVEALEAVRLEARAWGEARAQLDEQAAGPSSGSPEEAPAPAPATSSSSAPARQLEFDVGPSPGGGGVATYKIGRVGATGFGVTVRPNGSGVAVFVYPVEDRRKRGTHGNAGGVPAGNEA